MVKVRFFCWVIVLGISLVNCQAIVAEKSQPSSQPGSPDRLDENIRKLRTGDLVIRVIDSQDQPVAGGRVQLTQTAHEFEFGTALSSHMFQDKVNPSQQAQYLKLARQLFNAGVHENALKWPATEPQPDRVNYDLSDRILRWTERHYQKTRGHTLFWAVEERQPSWLIDLNSAQLRRAAQNRATDVCTRYRGRIDEYDVNNEMLHGSFFRQRLGEGIVKEMFRWCHQADPTATLYLNDYDILNGKELDRYVALIRSLLNQGVPIGGIGVQGHLYGDVPPAQIKQSLDTLAQFNLPIKITEFDGVGETEEEQARILTAVYQTAFAHPAVEGIYLWGFWEGAHWRPQAAIFRRDFTPKPAAKAYQDLVFNQWWTKTSGRTNSTGNYRTRAFFGKYRVQIITPAGKAEQTFNFTPEATTPSVIKIGGN